MAAMTLPLTSLQKPNQTADFDVAEDNKVYAFPASVWDPIRFTMPSRGYAFVSVSADMFCEPGDPDATVECSWTANATIVGYGRSIAGHGVRVNCGRRTLIKAAAGTAITVTPQYRVIHASNEQSGIELGALMVEVD